MTIRKRMDEAVANAYLEADGPLSNNDLYGVVADKLGVQLDLFHEKSPVGDKNPTMCSLHARAARWSQQTLKAKGYLRPVARGEWALTTHGRNKLHQPANRAHTFHAYSTKLGLAVVGYAQTALDGLDDHLGLILTSPPYPLAKPRAYGNVSEQEYVDWLCRTIEPAIARLRAGGNLVLNLSPDIFQTGLPSRSLYLERLLIALEERFGLALMDRIIWHNTSRAPGPIQWASKARNQLNATYEMCLWLTNDPTKVCANNNRVLEQHTERHQKLLSQGGERRDSVTADGAHRIRAGKSFSNLTPGRIPRNVLRISHSCASQRRYKAMARAAGLTPHGAPMPLELALFFVRFLTEAHHVVLDLFAGSGTVPLAAEMEGRPWYSVEQFAEYAMGAALRVQDRPGFTMNLDLHQLVTAYS